MLFSCPRCTGAHLASPNRILGALRKMFDFLISRYPCLLQAKFLTACANCRSNRKVSELKLRAAPVMESWLGCHAALANPKPLNPNLLGAAPLCGRAAICVFSLSEATSIDIQAGDTIRFCRGQRGSTSWRANLLIPEAKKKDFLETQCACGVVLGTKTYVYCCFSC